MIESWYFVYTCSVAIAAAGIEHTAAVWIVSLHMLYCGFNIYLVSIVSPWYTGLQHNERTIPSPPGIQMYENVEPLSQSSTLSLYAMSVLFMYALSIYLASVTETFYTCLPISIGIMMCLIIFVKWRLHDFQFHLYIPVIHACAYNHYESCMHPKCI